MSDKIAKLYESVEDALIREVLQPWEEATADSCLPWEASPELRVKWGDMLAAGRFDPKTTAAFLGLCRCSYLSEEEARVAARYYLSNEETNLNLFISYLLTGASPPIALWQGYFLKVLQRDFAPQRHFWEQLSAFMRHPAFGPVIEDFSQIKLPPSVVAFLLLNNAGIAGRRVQFVGELDNPWIAAAYIGTVRKEELSHLIPDDPLLILRILLRTDLDCDDLRQLRLKTNVEESFSLMELDHPAVKNGASPDYDPLNPSEEAIRYHAFPGRITGLAKYRNPLLNHPWLTESAIVARSQSDIFTGLCLLGLPPFDYQKITSKSRLVLTEMLANHPMAGLARQYLQPQNEK